MLSDTAERSKDYAFAREILRYAIQLAKEWDRGNALSLLQEGLYLAHFEVTEELGDMRDELLELGLTPGELDHDVAEGSCR